MEEESISKYSGIIQPLIDKGFISKAQSSNFNLIRSVVNELMTAKAIRSTRMRLKLISQAISLVIEKVFIYIPIFSKFTFLFIGLSKLVTQLFDDNIIAIDNAILENIFIKRNTVTIDKPIEHTKNSVMYRMALFFVFNVIGALFPDKSKQEDIREVFDTIIKIINGEYDPISPDEVESINSDDINQTSSEFIESLSKFMNVTIAILPVSKRV